ncbi:hypothetical protein RFI_04268 [Reticulomyxa filosa]|uniref:Uncharacterized protein n=1 Tax=Reticulomyxa filosa TaxID=46433 RepID=X6P3Z8_RETFI|nr:hypothetical protein RFI_04268 [Reticulomyxa filosa]|eukprot:ETO32848.1 hypothetical protein RFI_04268 [Reticulomyxa filosa]
MEMEKEENEKKDKEKEAEEEAKAEEEEEEDFKTEEEASLAYVVWPSHWKQHLLNVGIFGTMCISRNHLYLEFMKQSLRAIHPHCRELYRNGQWKEYLETCEMQMLEILVACDKQAYANLKPILPANRHKKLPDSSSYTQKFLSHVLSDVRVLEMLLLLAKIWLQWPLTQEYEDEYDKEMKKEENNRKHKSKGAASKIKDKDKGKKKDNKNKVKHKNKSKYKKDKQWIKWSLDLLKILIEIVYISKHTQRLEKQSSMCSEYLAELCMMNADLHFQNEDYDDCYKLLIQASDLVPNNPYPIQFLHLVIEKKRHHTKIFKTIHRRLNTYIHANENPINYALMGANNLLVRGYCDDALELYEKALQWSENQNKQDYVVRLHFLIGVAMLEHAVKRTTQNPNFYMMKGMCYFKKYMTLSNSNIESLYNFGRALHMLGLFGPASIYYNRVIDIVYKKFPNSISSSIKQNIKQDKEHDNKSYNNMSNWIDNEKFM